MRAGRGPPPQSFASTKEWIESRNAVFPVESTELEDWIGKIEGDSWISLFIPIAGWKFLEPQTQKLQGNVLDRLLLMAGGAPQLAEMVRHREFIANNSLILRTLATIAHEIGPSFLEDSELVRAFRHPEISSSEEFDGSELLDKVESLSGPPEFCAAVLNLLLRFADVELSRLIAFWKSHCQSAYVWLDGSPDELMRELVAMGTTDSVCLAASLREGFHQRRTSPDVSTRVAQAYCKHLIDAPELSSFDIRRLLGLPAQVQEIELWCREEAIHALQDFEWGRETFRERLFEIINSTSVEHERIREVLCMILRKRHNYCVEIGLGAVDAIHRLDELMTAPLTDQDWQAQRD